MTALLILQVVGSWTLAAWAVGYLAYMLYLTHRNPAALADPFTYAAMAAWPILVPLALCGTATDDDND
jgi:hypothetical protein